MNSEDLIELSHADRLSIDRLMTLLSIAYTELSRVAPNSRQAFEIQATICVIRMQLTHVKRAQPKPGPVPRFGR